MTRRARTLAPIIDALANALQVAVGLAGPIRRAAETTAADAVHLEASLARAVAALGRLQPTRRKNGAR